MEVCQGFWGGTNASFFFFFALGLGRDRNRVAGTPWYTDAQRLSPLKQRDSTGSTKPFQRIKSARTHGCFGSLLTDVKQPKTRKPPTEGSRGWLSWVFEGCPRLLKHSLPSFPLLGHRRRSQGASGYFLFYMPHIFPIKGTH
ncbi:UNVERIFIED_CONTAM: hypothetical protein K2H54_015051 [Gekko kuhli]